MEKNKQTAAAHFNDTLGCSHLWLQLSTIIIPVFLHWHCYLYLGKRSEYDFHH